MSLFSRYAAPASKPSGFCMVCCCDCWHLQGMQPLSVAMGRLSTQWKELMQRPDGNGTRPARAWASWQPKGTVKLYGGSPIFRGHWQTVSIYTGGECTAKKMVLHLLLARSSRIARASWLLTAHWSASKTLCSFRSLGRSDQPHFLGSEMTSSQTLATYP